MKRFIKFLLAIVAVLAVVLIFAVIVAVWVIDPNQYKDEIAAAVHKATGRELTVQGDLKLSVFPWLGVETGAMRLSNAPGFGAEPFAQINAAAVRVKLLPLLRRDVKVDTVTLDGLNLHLIRNTAGVTNWSDLTAQGEGAAPKDKAAEPADKRDSGALSALAIDGVRVRNATVDWDDRQNKAHYLLSNLALRTGPVSLDKPVKVELQSDVRSDAPALTGHLALMTQARYVAAAQRAQLRDLQLTLQAQPQAMAANEVQLKLSGDADLDLAAQQYRIDGLQATATLRGSQLPGKEIKASLAAQAVADLAKQTLEVHDLRLDAWNFRADGALNGSGLLESPRFTGTLIVPDFNARELLGHLDMKPLNTADPQALTTVGANLTFDASTTAAELTQLELRVDQTHLKGYAAIQDFAHPAYRFQLDADQFDADRYLPPTGEGKAQATTPAGAGAAQLPLETLRALDMDGALSLGRLKLAGLTVTDIKTQLNAHTGVIRAAPLSAKLYGGRYDGDMRLNAQGKEVQIATNERLDNVDIGALSRDLLNKDLAAGTGSVQIKLRGTGIDPERLKRTLNGNVGFSFRDGRVLGVNLIALIKQDYLKYLQQLSVNPRDLNQTVFSKFAATATVAKGVIETTDLVLNSAQLDIKGRGTVNLVNEQLNLHLQALPVGQFAKELQQYSTSAVPIKVEGALTAPHFSAEVDQLIKNKARERLDKEKEQLKEQLQEKSQQQQDKLEQQLRDKLKGLFK